MKPRRMGCAILAIALSLSLSMPFTSSASGFSDTAGHWAETYINTAVNKNIITGYPDGRFLPDKAVARAEFATMMNKALGNSGTTSLSFRDVRSGDWYYNDIAKAVSAAYTTGYDDGTFRPDNPITRQEAAVMLARIVPAYGSAGNLKSYRDYRSIADWAYDSLQKVNGKGYIGAYEDGQIHPTDQLTRAQTAKIICDILDNETIVSGNPVVDHDGTKLSGKIYPNNVTIDEDLGDGSATIENCVILGALAVKGGGTDSITVSNSRVANATVDKDDDPVRVLAKGETNIVRLSASQKSTLQTSGLSGGLFGPGFSSVNVNGSAELTLKGSFPAVTVSGSKANVTLNSGSIDALTVGGRYSNITAASGTTIGTATVNAESYFHGSGAISQMNVNADGITYETKPKKWTVSSSADTPKQSDDIADITFSPKDGATNVKRDTKITITFNSAVELYRGGSVTSSNIDDFVELRKGSSSGSKVAYTASINSSKTIITITPSDDLTENTKYYVIIGKNSIRSGDSGNDALSIKFTTGDDYGSVTTTFSPENEATVVSVNTPITITFSESVVRYSNGDSIGSGDSYLKDCLVFKKNGSSGDSVSYTASISSSKKIITITPNSALTLNQKYYVAVIGSKLKTKDDGETIPAASATWTTGVVTPVVDSLSLTPGETAITASLSSNVAGTAYLVALPAGDPAPNAAQIIAGQNASGIAVDSGYKASDAVSANTLKTFSLSGFASNTQYKIYAAVSASGINSAVKSVDTTTVKPVTTLSKLEVVPAVDGLSAPGNQISFNKSTANYDIALNTGITTLAVNAAGPGNISIDGNAAVSDSTSKTVALSGAAQTIIITIEKSGTTGTTYTINVTRTNNTGVSALKVASSGDGALSDDGNGNYTLPSTGDVTITIDVTANDKFASVILDGAKSVGKGNASVSLPADKSALTYEFSVVSGSDSKTYTLKFVRAAAPPSPAENAGSGVN